MQVNTAICRIHVFILYIMIRKRRRRKKKEEDVVTCCLQTNERALSFQLGSVFVTGQLIRWFWLVYSVNISIMSKIS